MCDEAHKLFCRNTTAARQPFEGTQGLTDEVPERAIRLRQLSPAGPLPQGGQVQMYADQIVLSRYGPAGMIIDEALRIKGYRGEVGEFLVAPPAEMPQRRRSDACGPVT